uniref:L51_S25_CI-B8 domain-containing protein n=1 Tax=Panagrellus redivivus TaxID=6233 RepID=A0A7E4V4V3_PANRE
MKLRACLENPAIPSSVQMLQEAYPRFAGANPRLIDAFPSGYCIKANRLLENFHFSITTTPLTSSWDRDDTSMNCLSLSSSVYLSFSLF